MVGKDKKVNEYTYITAVIGGALLVAVVLGFAALRPLYNSLKSTNLELKEKKEILTKLEANLENLKNLESKKEELVAKNQKVLSALPTNKDVPRLFVQLERIATSSGLQVTSVSESGESAPGTVTGLVTPVLYRISGTATDYVSLKQALKNIETGLRIISAEKIDVQGSSAGTNLTVSLLVKTYSRGQQ